MTSVQDPPLPPGALPAGHPVCRLTASLDRALDALVDAPLWSMTTAEQRRALVDLTRAEARLEELRLRVLAQADRSQVGADSGATSTAAWLAHEVKATRAACFADLHLAQALEDEFPLTRAAMAASSRPRHDADAPADVAGSIGTGSVGTGSVGTGVVDAEKARIIVRAVRELTDEHGDLVDADVRFRAEAHLVELAREFDSAVLRQMAKRLFEVICPEAADAAEAAKLAKEEADARRAAYLSIRDNGDGTSDGRFRLPTLHTHLLKKAVQTLTGPRRIGEGRFDPETGTKLPAATLAGHGLMELLEDHLDLGTMPTTGGSPFTLNITISLDTLEAGLGVATTETGHRISAGEARRLACKAGIIPIVLDGASMPLDVGREQRLFTRYQKTAINQRYGHQGCAAVNCDRPPAWVEYHHEDPWGAGGRTDHRSGIPLCPPHHHMADRPQSWNMRKLPTGGVRFTRRT